MRYQKHVCLVLGLTAIVGLVARPVHATQLDVRSTSVEERSDWSWFIEQSARVLTVLNHTHVGASTSLGARWRWLSFGLSTLYRPAAWSNERVQLDLPEGETYRGQSRVGFGQQYGYLGLYVSPAVRFESLPELEIDLPLTIGQGILGTPLQDEDRETPTGELVSEVEDELLDGEDLAFGTALDVGLRVRWFPWDDENGNPLGLGFMVGAHYTNFLGYEGPLYDSEDLAGFSASLGLIFSPR